VEIIEWRELSGDHVVDIIEWAIFCADHVVGSTVTLC